MYRPLNVSLNTLQHFLAHLILGDARAERA
jgi:hypothetical protein